MPLPSFLNYNLKPFLLNPQALEVAIAPLKDVYRYIGASVVAPHDRNSVHQHCQTLQRDVKDDIALCFGDSAFGQFLQPLYQNLFDGHDCGEVFREPYTSVGELNAAYQAAISEANPVAFESKTACFNYRLALYHTYLEAPHAHAAFIQQVRNTALDPATHDQPLTPEMLLKFMAGAREMMQDKYKALSRDRVWQAGAYGTQQFSIAYSMIESCMNPVGCDAKIREKLEGTSYACALQQNYTQQERRDVTYYADIPPEDHYKTFTRYEGPLASMVGFEKNQRYAALYRDGFGDLVRKTIQRCYETSRDVTKHLPGQEAVVAYYDDALAKLRNGITVVPPAKMSLAQECLLKAL